MSNNIIDCLISHYFHIQISKEYVNQSIKEIPDNVFGVFVTILRTGIYKTKHENVYGCIGNWNEKYEKWDNKKIFETILNVGDGAMFNDPRNLNFGSILNDIESVIEVSYMMSPIIPVSITEGKLETGENFDNNKYGLIFETADRLKATYLPKVFENISWSDIKQSIMDKAGIHSTNIREMNSIRFSAYRTIEVKQRLYDILNVKYFDSIKEVYLGFINKYYKDFIPYDVRKINGKTIVKIDKNEEVRNISTIAETYKINKKYNKLSHKILDAMRNIILYYGKNYSTLSNQTNIFLLSAVNEFEISKSLITNLCNLLYERLNELDDDFSLCEALMVLTQICPRENILIKLQEDIYMKELKELSELNDIFRLNWQSQFLLALFLRNYKSKYLIQHCNLIRDKVVILFTRYFENTKEFMEIQNIFAKKAVLISTEIETNYWAVLFECLTPINHMVSNKLLKYIFMVFMVLQRRYNGLYPFINGESRLDITMHIINGIENLK